MSFQEIRGQERAIGLLKRVIAKRRIPHAYLFTGIPGVGKTMTARALAMALNCEAPVEGSGCGRCAVCRQVQSGNCPDFLLIGPEEQSIKIGQIRSLARALAFAPQGDRYRVSVIHQAERMTAEAANAFLKTLEEPPPHNILVLKTAEPRDVPATIASRCQRIAFQPLAPDWIQAELGAQLGLAEAQAEVLERVSEQASAQEMVQFSGS